MVSQRLSNPAQSVLDAIRRIVQVLRKSSRESERRVGLTAAQLFVMTKLDSERPLSLNELARRTPTHQSSVSVVVSRLVARRLVTRRPSPVDKRRVALALTKRGRALVARAPTVAQERVIEGLARLPPKRLNQLAEA